MNVKRTAILIKSTYSANTPNFIQIGGRAYPVRHYPVAIRLRDRNSTPHQFTKLVGDSVCRALLCIALIPQSGDFSGAILGVRSVALLHLDEDGDRLFIIIPKQAAWLGGMVDMIEKEQTDLTLTEAQIAELEKELMATFETFTVILSLSKKVNPPLHFTPYTLHEKIA